MVAMRIKAAELHRDRSGRGHLHYWLVTYHQSMKAAATKMRCSIAKRPSTDLKKPARSAIAHLNLPGPNRFAEILQDRPLNCLQRRFFLMRR